eukprot:scaffold79906_cov66-Phaeocystis_antarctica.AAC.1
MCSSDPARAAAATSAESRAPARRRAGGKLKLLTHALAPLEPTTVVCERRARRYGRVTTSGLAPSICVCVRRPVRDRACLDPDAAWLALDRTVSGLLTLDLAQPQQFHVEDQRRPGRHLDRVRVRVR